MARLISFVIKSDFGFFKKPEINEVYLTYTIPPKPLILGILGAILGLKGLKEQYYEKKSLPEYYEKLKDLKIGVTPLKDNFPFNKIMNKYNSRNSYFYTTEDGAENLPIIEQLIIKPSYKIFVYDPKSDNKIFSNLIKLLEKNQTIFIPYMGKNDFPLEIDNFKEHASFEEMKEEIDNLLINSIYVHNIKNSDEKKLYDGPRFVSFSGVPAINKPSLEFDFYENIPVAYNENMLYRLETIRYTSKQIKKEEISLEKSKLIKLNNHIIYVF